MTAPFWNWQFLESTIITPFNPETPSFFASLRNCEARKSYPLSDVASIAIIRKPLSVTVAFTHVNPVIVSIYLSAPVTWFSDFELDLVIY